ncbi:MAG TPA: VOC family protein [Patescibacteria group bacterium]|nr:VOC family protein [Patescibacteria group bacterium]
MLSSVPVIAVLPATDLERAKMFYTQKLGLMIDDTMSDANGFVAKAGMGTALMVYKRPEPTKAEHTVAGFKVDNLEQEVADLKTKGVVFEQYSLPGLVTDSNGIAIMGNTKNAWFKDSEGNIIAVSQMVAVAPVVATPAPMETPVPAPVTPQAPAPAATPSPVMSETPGMVTPPQV